MAIYPDHTVWRCLEAEILIALGKPEEACQVAEASSGMASSLSSLWAVPDGTMQCRGEMNRMDERELPEEI